MTRAATLLFLSPLLAVQAGCCVFPLFPRLHCGSACAPVGAPAAPLVGFTGPVGTPVGYGPVGGGGPANCVSCGHSQLGGAPIAQTPPFPQVIASSAPPYGPPPSYGPPSIFGPTTVIAPPSSPLPAPSAMPR